MARLETQINQIYLTDPANKKTSLILYEEQISPSAQLFILAELWDIRKKTEETDLKKISEIILESFRANKRLAAEALFESSLAQINQNLADLAHSGRKSWVGKFSAVLCLKSGDNIFAANDGACACFLHRKGELVEILPAEKRGDHPFKTFINFTQGRLAPSDNLIINTSNIFDYVSIEHFSEILNRQTPEQASVEISKILQDSLNESQAFCAFLLSFTKPQAAGAPAQPETKPEPIYPPLPEDLPPSEANARFGKLSFSRPAWLAKPKIRLGRIAALQKLQWSYFQNLSRPAKFFFISFSIFLILFLANLTNYLVNRHYKTVQMRIENQITLVNQDLTEAQSAIIYKNNDEALNAMNRAQKDFETLLGMDEVAAKKLEPRLENVKTQINKISRIENAQVIATLKRNPVSLGKAPTAFLLAGEDSNSLSQYSGSALKEYFLLNSLKNNVTGIAFMPGVGVVVSSGNLVSKINKDMQQFETIVSVDQGQLSAIRAGAGGLYVLDLAGRQVLRLTLNKTKIQSTKAASIENGDIRDIGADKDLYILSADRLTKISGGASTNIPLPNLTDGISNANKLFVGANLYILEANKKRVVVLSKTGSLLNQIYFPNARDLRDLYIDEAARSMYLLDGDKLEKITF